MKSASLLCLSVCLNLALAGVANHYYFKKPAGRSSAAATNAVPVVVPEQPESGTRPAVPDSCITNRFHWRMLESTNYEEYVANLRAVGCPEKTVRDIILADVKQLYAVQCRAAGVKGPFWLAGNRRRVADRAREEELVALKQEQEALIRHLLGIEWFADSDRQFDRLEEQALSRFILGPMPEETFQRVVHLFGKYEALKSEIDRRCGGIRLEEDEAQLRRLNQQLRQELASVLAPAQLDELKARGSAGLFNQTELAGVEVTPAEARQIALAKAAAGGRMFDWSDDGTDEERSANEEKFQAAVRKLLGEKRYADFERAQDNDFRTLYKFGQDHGLAQAVAVQVYEIRKLTRDEVQRLRQDSTLDEAARRQRLEEMQASLQKAVLSALGSAVCQEYLQRDGAWVTNLNKL